MLVLLSLLASPVNATSHGGTSDDPTTRTVTVAGEELDSETLQVAGGLPTSTDPSLAEPGVATGGRRRGCSSSGIPAAPLGLLLGLILGLVGLICRRVNRE